MHPGLRGLMGVGYRPAALQKLLFAKGTFGGYSSTLV
jgi:hypothetical protein